MKCFSKLLIAAAMAAATFGQQPAAPAPAPARTNSLRALLPPTNALTSGGRQLQRFDRTAFELTPEQREKLDEVNKSYTSIATPIFARLATARRELEMLVNADKYDEATLKAKAKEIGDLEAELAIARAKRYSKLTGFLTPDQARRLNQPAPIARPFQPALHEGQTPPPVAPNK
jgi:Spy/CpxP family protein refolding chaperone